MALLLITIYLLAVPVFQYSLESISSALANVSWKEWEFNTYSDWLMMSLHFQDHRFVFVFEDLSELTFDKTSGLIPRRKSKHCVFMKG